MGNVGAGKTENKNLITVQKKFLTYPFWTLLRATEQMVTSDEEAADCQS